MKIDVVKARRLYLDVAQQLETLIVGGKINAGERLPSERDLASRFGVSRPTIREAMIALEIAGLIEIRTGSGIYVLQRKTTQKLGVRDDGPGPFDILEARCFIESEAVALAASRINDEQLLALEQVLQTMESEDAESSVSEQADQAFHCIIAEASENSALSSMVSWLWDLRNEGELSALFHQRVRDKGIHPSVDEHRQIFNAIKARDPVAAKEAMHDHLIRAVHINEALLDQK